MQDFNGKVAARYIGTHEVKLHPYGVPYFDANGKRLEDLLLRYGDTLMMPAHEVLGMTWLTDPRCIEDPIQLGIGRVVLPEHQSKNESELIDMGYQFHAGRSDFEPIVVSSTVQDSGPSLSMPSGTSALSMASNEVTSDKKKKEAQ